MKILLATDHYLPHPGGSSRVIYETSRRLAAHGHRVTVLTFERDAELPAEEEIGGARVRRIPLRGRLSTYPLAYKEGYRAASQALREDDYDLLHIHLPLIGPGAQRAARHARIPTVASFYGPWGDEMRTELSAKPLQGARKATYQSYVRGLCLGLAAWQRQLLRDADRIILLSGYSQGQVRELVSQKVAARADLIPGGVDLARFHPAVDRQATRRGLGLPAEGDVLFSVRRLVPRMGIENLLEAVALLRDEGRQITLVIGGGGPLAGSLRAQAEALGIGGCTRFTGFIPDDELPAYYQAADLFVLPTLALEGFGLITLEALACGTPVIGTPVGSTAELLGSFDRRFLAAAVEPPALADAIRCGQDAAHAESDALRARCRQYANGFGWEEIVGRYEAVYGAAMGRRIV